MPLTQVTGGGALTRQNIADINNNFAALTNPDIWVRPQYGNNNTANGTYERPYATMAAALSSSLLRPGMTIGLLGVAFEQVTGPIVNDITIVGMANTPRQATTSGAANGGGATWLSPTSPSNTLALCTVQGQAWTFRGIYFNNSATSAGCVELVRAGDPPAAADASHAAFLNCKFTGAAYGITDNGGAGFVTVDGCELFNFTGSGDTAIKSLSTAQALPLQWLIQNTRFWNNVNHVVTPLSSATITNNNFGVIGSSLTTTIALSMTGGKNNSVYTNMFNRPLNTSPNATLFVGGTNDIWSQNWGSDGIFYGVPDNS